MPIMSRPQSILTEAVWRRIVNLSGVTFNQVPRQTFANEARGRTVYLHTMNLVIGRAAVEHALTRPRSEPCR